MFRSLSSCTLLSIIVAVSGCGGAQDNLQDAPPDMREQAIKSMEEGQTKAMEEMQKKRQGGPPMRR